VLSYPISTLRSSHEQRPRTCLNYTAVVSELVKWLVDVLALES
jgi:hypothetical protein